MLSKMNSIALVAATFVASGRADTAETCEYSDENCKRFFPRTTFNLIGMALFIVVYLFGHVGTLLEGVK